MLILLEPMTFTTGKAKDFALANLNISCTWSPVATPGLIILISFRN